jgi:hypothetical protein
VSDDLEAIPLDRSEAPPSPPRSAPRWRRPPAAATTFGLVAAALVAGWLLSGGSEPSSGSGRKAGQDASPGGSEILCPPGQGLAGTDLGQLVPSRESPEAAVADVAEAFGGYPVAGYRYQQEQRGGDWVGFLGTAGTVPKARISVRHLEDRWLAVAIAACAGDYPAGLVDYPADRPVPALSSTAGLLLAVNDPLQRIGPVATVMLQDAAGHAVWELPRIGAWYPTPLSWSPDGRRFLFQVSAGEQTDTRVVILPDGRDVAVPGALTWIGDDALLVTRDGRLGRLDLGSAAFVAGPPLTQYISSQAGTRGRAALVILPGATPGSGSGAKAQAPFVRILDSALQTRDTVAPPETVDCFSPAWTADGQRLDLVCRRSDPAAGSADTDVFEIDIATLRWTRLPTGTVGSAEQPLRSPSSGYSEIGTDLPSPHR